MIQDVTQYAGFGTGPFSRFGVSPPPAGDNMLDTVDAREAPSYVTTWSQPVAVNRTRSEDGVVCFITFGGEKDSWSKASYKKRKVQEEVKFRFGDENAGAAFTGDIDEVVDTRLEFGLDIKLEVAILGQLESRTE